MVLNAGSGVPPGLFCATDLFNWIYGLNLEDFRLSIQTQTSMMRVPSITDGNEILDTSITSFVDDFATTVFTAENLEIPDIEKLIPNKFSEALEPNEFT